MTAQVGLPGTIVAEHQGQTDSLGRSAESVWSAMAQILPRRGRAVRWPIRQVRGPDSAHSHSMVAGGLELMS